MTADNRTPGLQRESSPEFREGLVEGQIIVVTGAGGIGSEIVREAARQGAGAVIFTYRSSEESAHALAQEIADLGTGTQPVAVHADLAQPNSPDHPMRTLLQNAKKQFGRVDTIVNNAGVEMSKPYNSYDVGDFDLIMRTNVLPAIISVEESRGVFDRRQGGAIINIGSIVGLEGNTGQLYYAASKAALEGVMKGSYLDLARTKIRILNIDPGFIETPMTAGMDDLKRAGTIAVTPLGRLGQPSDVAYQVISLASPRSAFMTGLSIPVDGGLRGAGAGLNGVMRSGWRPKPAGT